MRKAHPLLADPGTLSVRRPRGPERGGLRIWTVATALLLGQGGVARATSNCDAVPGLLQIRLYPGVPIERINTAYGTSTRDSLPPFYLLEVPAGSEEDEILERLQDDQGVAGAEPAYRSETPEGPRQMVVVAIGGTTEGFQDQSFVERLRLSEIHPYATGEGVLVGLLDTGIDFDHSAFPGSLVVPGFDFVDGDSDPADEANAVDDDGDGLSDEGAGHGTMVAGLVHLVAPAARLLPVRVLDDEGRGSTFDVAKGIRYAVEQGAHVINLSLGLDCPSDILSAEIRRADSLGVSIVAAAGNSGTEDPPFYPASDPAVLSVTSLDSSDVKAPFASYHETVDLSTPGVGVLAPYSDGGYALGTGTSFSAAIVSGQCALIRDLNGALGKAQVDGVARLGTVDIYLLAGNAPYVGRLGSGRFDGERTRATASPPTSVRYEPGDGPSSLAVRAYPNPVPRGFPLTVEWKLSREAAAIDRGSLLAVLFDGSGRKIREDRLAGHAGRWVWDGRDRAGRPLPSGVYFLRIAGDDPRASIPGKTADSTPIIRY
jgi:subtilisin family serine protease